MSENRAHTLRAPRHKVLKGAKVVTHHEWSVVDCIVRNLSDSGALIQCKDQVAVPLECRLMITSDGTIQDVKVVWRRDDLLGVQFTSEKKHAPPRKF